MELATTEAVTTEESVDKLSVVATTPMIAEYVRQVGNDNIEFKHTDAIFYEIPIVLKLLLKVQSTID